MEYFIDCFKKYAVFKGRARRKEYWLFMLFFEGFFTPLWLLAMYYSRAFELPFIIFALVFITPKFAVTARRLHDINKSGWWALLTAGGLIAVIILTAWCVREGDAGDNPYGPNPKAERPS
ncbi:MAG: DUF805 domain-containing protein [Spirochaetaceae bacterium]|nr:DUF805 domain-containing protein [Spirochaetaceae bacterium]